MKKYLLLIIIWIFTLAVAISVFVSANNCVMQEEEETQETQETLSEAEIEEMMKTWVVIIENPIGAEPGETEMFYLCDIPKEACETKETETTVEPTAESVIETEVPKEPVVEPEEESVTIVEENEETNTIVLSNGEVIEYLYSDTSTVTSYCACEICCNHGVPEWRGITYSGRNLLAEENPKVLAADISRYPIGTVIFVEGYGIATVEDTGGAIDDRDLDVYIPSHKEAGEWGVREQLVYIISLGKWN